MCVCVADDPVCAVNPSEIHTGFVKQWWSDCGRLLLPHCFGNRVRGETRSRGRSRLLTSAILTLSWLLHQFLLEEFSEVLDLKTVREQLVIYRVYFFRKNPWKINRYDYCLQEEVHILVKLYFLSILSLFSLKCPLCRLYPPDCPTLTPLSNHVSEHTVAGRSFCAMS